MLDGVAWVARGLAVIGGATLLYSALFVVERAANDVQSTLEEWYIKGSDWEQSRMRLWLARAHGALDMADAALSRMFGERLLSPRFFAFFLQPYSVPVEAPHCVIRWFIQPACFFIAPLASANHVQEPGPQPKVLSSDSKDSHRCCLRLLFQSR